MYKNMNNDMKPTYTLIFILKPKLKRGHDTTIAKHWKQDSVRNLFLMSIYCGRVGVCVSIKRTLTKHYIIIE